MKHSSDKLCLVGQIPSPRWLGIHFLSSNTRLGGWGADSNLGSRDQSPLPYRLATPQSIFADSLAAEPVLASSLPLRPSAAEAISALASLAAMSKPAQYPALRQFPGRRSFAP